MFDKRLISTRDAALPGELVVSLSKETVGCSVFVCNVLGARVHAMEYAKLCV
jgi:hypothetical protein